MLVYKLPLREGVFILAIPRCYDSHVHLQATGMMTKGLHLADLRSPLDVRHLKIEPHHFRGEWLVGFGWDENNWDLASLPHYRDLDRVFSEYPVVFSRADGHAAWLNSIALRRAGFADHPTGVLLDADKAVVDAMLPSYSKEQIKQFLLWGQDEFLRNGFTHVRDMAGDQAQWQALQELEAEGLLKIFVEENFVCEKLSALPEILSQTQAARKSESPHLRVHGLKIYLDGALGSQGAYLSQPYAGTSERGFLLWTPEDLYTVMKTIWVAGLTFVVHAIGDGTSDLVIRTALKLQSEGISGKLSIEHAEVIRTDTIDLMKSLDVTCYMQPCHWLSDSRWLKQKLGSLSDYAFPWRKLVEAGVPVYWGSDSPIERPSLEDTRRALVDSAKAGVPAYPLEWWQGHVHPDESWGSL